MFLITLVTFITFLFLFICAYILQKRDHPDHISETIAGVMFVLAFLSGLAFGINVLVEYTRIS